MDWDGLRLLMVVAAHGSLRGAAGELGISQPTLGRRLRDLEDGVGVPLLVRHARGVELTLEGQAAVEAARAVAGQLDTLQRGLSGRRAEVRGRVRISCTEPVAMEALPGSLRQLRREHPRLAVDIVVDARASDLDRREADLAVRMFQPQHASLIARQIGASFTAFYASRAYLEAHGRPTSLAELMQGHDLIAPDREPLFVRQAAALGFDLDLAAVRTDSFATTAALTRAGVAIGALVGTLADRDPDLVRLFEPLNEYPVWLVTHPDLFTSASVRAVWDRLVEDLPPFFAP